MNSSIPKVHFITQNGNHYTVTLKEDGLIKTVFLYYFNSPVCCIEYNGNESCVYINKAYYSVDPRCLFYLPKVIKKTSREIKQNIQLGVYKLIYMQYE